MYIYVRFTSRSHRWGEEAVTPRSSAHAWYPQLLLSAVPHEKGSLDPSGGSQVSGRAKSQGVVRTSCHSRKQETDGSETRHQLQERAADKDKPVEHPEQFENEDSSWENGGERWKLVSPCVIN